MAAQIPAPVERLLNAANGHDTDAFIAAFVDDGAVDDWGREFVGPEAVRGWSDREFIGKRVSLEIRDVRQDGDTTVVTAQVGGDGFNGPSHFGFLLRGARFSRMTIRA
jgi:SnoaL-like domain